MNSLFIFVLCLFFLHLFDILFTGTLFNLINIIITLIFGYFLIVGLQLLTWKPVNLLHVDGRIRGKEIDIEFNEIENNKPKELKLHHVTPLPQKITSWCIRNTFTSQHIIKFY